MEYEENIEIEGLNVKVRTAFFLGVFTLGVSMIAGDLVGVLNIPLSSLSVTTTMFGGVGAILCEMFARRI